MHPVDTYQNRQSFFFGTNESSLVTQGQSIVLPARDSDASSRAETILETLGPGSLVVGAIPFRDSDPAHLIVPANYEWGPPLSGTELSTTEPPSLGESDNDDSYQEAVRTALRYIGQQRLSKIVLTRSIDVPLAGRPHVPALMRTLRYLQSDGYTFALELPGNRSLFGASPELLVERQGHTVRAFPLAGSRPRSYNSEVDASRSKELLDSDKDRREHSFVVDRIAEILRPRCRELSIPGTPSVVAASSMLHLGTPIVGHLHPSSPGALSLASELHPTPAICGTPTSEAYAAIGELEQYDRGFYTGMVGWSDSSGNGKWAVAIRCAEATEERVRLYAGAGIVAGSTPNMEFSETEAKLATMQRVVNNYTREAANGHGVHSLA